MPLLVFTGLTDNVLRHLDQRRNYSNFRGFRRSVQVVPKARNRFLNWSKLVHRVWTDKQRPHQTRYAPLNHLRSSRSESLYRRPFQSFFFDIDWKGLKALPLSYKQVCNIPCMAEKKAKRLEPTFNKDGQLHEMAQVVSKPKVSKTRRTRLIQICSRAISRQAKCMGMLCLIRHRREKIVEEN